jgi:hypothetical protein
VNLESTFHALWSYLASVAVWQECGRKLLKMVIEECDGFHLIKLQKERLDNEGFMEAMLVLRLLWLRRNKYIFKGRFQPPSQIIMTIRNMVAEYEKTPQEEPTGPEAVANIPLNWRAPRVGWLKASWDATFNNTSRKWVLG